VTAPGPLPQEHLVARNSHHPGGLPLDDFDATRRPIPARLQGARSLHGEVAGFLFGIDAGGQQAGQRGPGLAQYAAAAPGVWPGVSWPVPVSWLMRAGSSLIWAQSPAIRSTTSVTACAACDLAPGMDVPAGLWLVSPGAGGGPGR